MPPPAGNSRRLRLVLVIGTLERGGAEHQLVALARGLDRDRFDVRVCCLSAGGPLETELAACDIPVDVVGWHGWSSFSGLGMVSGPYALLVVINRLRRYFRTHRPDIVQGQLFWAYVIGAFAARAAGVPVFVSCRRSLPDFKSANARHRFLERWANRLTTVVVANSDVVRVAAMKAERLPAERIVTIRNGVRVAGAATRESLAAARAAMRAPDGGDIVLCVANLIAYKGHHDLLAAWALVRTACRHAVLVLAGDGPERARVEARAAQIGGVAVLGSRADVATLMAAASLVVQASHEEGLPNAILEAMASARAVVATDVGGTRELVVHDETGLLVAPRQTSELAAAIIGLLREPEARARMGSAGLSRARREFSVASMVEAYARLYEHHLREATA